MNVGLPGTGIAGLFYLLSAAIILFYEIALTLIGKSSKKRWGRILPQISIAIMMIFAGYLTALAFTASLEAYRRYEGLPQKEIVNMNMLLVPVILLAGVLIIVYFTQFFILIMNRVKHRKLIRMTTRS